AVARHDCGREAQAMPLTDPFEAKLAANQARRPRVKPSVPATPPSHENSAAPVEAPVTAPLPFVKASTFAGQPVPPREWLVKDRIPRRNVTLLYGDGGTGKTTIAGQLAVQVGAGSADWLGGHIECNGPVIFFTAEEDEHEMHRRLADAAAHHRI